MNQKYTDQKKKKHILAKLVRGRYVGEKYTPKGNTYGPIPSHERGNLDDLLDELHKKGYIEYHKGRDCISINRKNKDKVKELIEDEVPEFYWDNF